MSVAEYRAFWARLKAVKGREGLPDAEPSTAQIIALKTKIVDMRMEPAADFAPVTNFHPRFMRTLKSMNHIIQPDGTVKTVEVSGLPDYDARYSS